MTLYIAINGEKLGPYSIAEAQNLVALGSLRATELAWYEGLTDWIPLNQVPGFTRAKRPGPVWIICLLIFIFTPFLIFQKISTIYFFATFSLKTAGPTTLHSAFYENGDMLRITSIALFGDILYLIGALYLFCIDRPALKYFIGAFVCHLLTDGIIILTYVSSPALPEDFFTTIAVGLTIDLVIIGYTWTLFKKGILR